MLNINLEAATEALSTVHDPDLHKDLITLNMARNIEILSGNKVKFNLVLTTPACPLKAKIEEDCREALLKAGASEVEIETTAEVRGFRGLPGKQAIPGIAHIVAVSSGKGGVGKSTVSVNLAVSLAKLGAKVGLLDADITGPNIPLMLGIKEKPSTTTDGKKILPLEGHGIKVISMGLLLADDEPVVWRGPMLHNAISQFFRDVAWGDLDYLIVDLPPGTSDAQLTIAQSVPLSGVVIVSTPQEVALLDSKKGLMMFRQMGVNIIGLVENMSYFIAPDTGVHYAIFGSGGAKLVAENLGIECLGQIPLQIAVREGGDNGKPICSSDPEGEVAQVFAQIAQRVAAQISILNAHQPELSAL
ncbi:MAG: iron-sulfur cluster carrier protein ApbC [Candidatus Caenarcaniphilales bacterium]|nr:iron-sulfur cluster carrier protein ApbC [Candidatus Caenarcaniphilales bacterium]